MIGTKLWRNWFGGGMAGLFSRVLHKVTGSFASLEVKGDNCIGQI